MYSVLNRTNDLTTVLQALGKKMFTVSEFSLCHANTARIKHILRTHQGEHPEDPAPEINCCHWCIQTQSLCDTPE